jgi:hypothetical protein
VPGRFAFLSKFGVKFVEVAGAGLASAACAYFLGLVGQPPPPAAPPAIVQVMPSEDALRMARDDHALLAALVRKETESRKDAEGRKDVESRKDSESQAKPEAAAAPKPAKPPQAAQARRSQKPEQTAASEPQLRASEPLAIQPPLAAANATPKPAAQTQSPTALLGRDGFATAAPTGDEEERPLFARLRQIPSLFLPENERVFGNIPRPPMPVGEFLPSAM